MTAAELLTRKADEVRALGEEYADPKPNRGFSERDFYLLLEFVLRALVDALENEDDADKLYERSTG
jgi:hypothetical protein